MAHVFKKMTVYNVLSNGTILHDITLQISLNLSRVYCNAVLQYSANN